MTTVRESNMNMRRFQLVLWSGLLSAPVWAQEGAAKSTPSVFEGHLGEAFWALIWFGLLLLVLWRFAWKPLLGGLTSRQEYEEREDETITQCGKVEATVVMSHTFSVISRPQAVFGDGAGSGSTFDGGAAFW